MRKNTLLRILWNTFFKMTGMDLSFDVHYRDISQYLIEMRARYEPIRKWFDDKGWTPLEVSSGETKVMINFLDLKKVPLLGPYKEVSIHVPIEPFDESKYDTFAHLYLPVTSEAARWGGVDINGFPKFLADIDIRLDKGMMYGSLVESGKKVMDIQVKDGSSKENELRWDIYGYRKGKVTSTTFEMKGSYLEREPSNEDKITLGDHKISEELRKVLISEEIQKVSIGKDLTALLRKPIVIT